MCLRTHTSKYFSLDVGDRAVAAELATQLRHCLRQLLGSAISQRAERKTVMFLSASREGNHLNTLFKTDGFEMIQH